MLDLFLPEVIAYMQDDDTVTGREEALIQLDDWYYDYGKAIDDYYSMTTTVSMPATCASSSGSSVCALTTM
mgnify:CR=1 FL=1